MHEWTFETTFCSQERKKEDGRRVEKRIEREEDLYNNAMWDFDVATEQLQQQK
jgi:hypothetical protein